jgi:FixJ family two-component response regulator
MASAALVCIVDDDESVRESLIGLLRSVGFETRGFASAEDYLAANADSVAHAAIVDVTMPGMNGADLQEQLLADGHSVPIVFITARTEPALHARLLERGAVACLVKPFREDELLTAVRAASALAAHRDRETIP